MQKQSGKTVAPLLTQVKHRYFAADCGMTYLIRLQDGRFVIIDGGYDEPGEAVHLFSLLTEQNVLKGKPHIAAWFITHPHDDHFGGFVGLCREFPARFILDTLVYNWPSDSITTGFSDLAPFDVALASLSDTKIVTAKTGQSFTYGDSVFDILFTWEDLCPVEGLVNMNDCSLVLRWTIGERRVLFLGDAMGAASKVICERYGDADLQAEFLQVGHHGYGGGSDELYRRVNPKTLLWPCPDFWFHSVRLWSCNEFLITANSIEQTIVNGQQEVTLDMTAPTPLFAPYPPCDTVVYEETFENTDPYRLGWSALTGGATGNLSPQLVLGVKCCTLTVENGRAVCEWVQPGRMQGIDTFTLRLKGSISTATQAAGLVFNNATPTVWEDAAFWQLPAGEPFEAVLTVDAEKGVVSLSVNGEQLRKETYIPAVRHGIYFSLQNGTATIQSIVVTKGV